MKIRRTLRLSVILGHVGYHSESVVWSMKFIKLEVLYEGYYSGSVVGDEYYHSENVAGNDGYHDGSSVGNEGYHSRSSVGNKSYHGGSVMGNEGYHSGSVEWNKGYHSGTEVGGEERVIYFESAVIGLSRWKFSRAVILGAALKRMSVITVTML